MAVQYSIFSVLSSQIKKKITLFSMMMPIGRLSEACFQLSSFWNSKGSSLRVKCTNGNRLSSCILLKNMLKRMVQNTFVGAEIIRWNFKNETFRIEKQKAPIWCRSFFYIVRCRWNVVVSILASHVFTCNNYVRIYV